MSRILDIPVALYIRRPRYDTLEGGVTFRSSFSSYVLRATRGALAYIVLLYLVICTYICVCTCKLLVIFGFAIIYMRCNDNRSRLGQTDHTYHDLDHLSIYLSIYLSAVDHLVPHLPLL